MCFASVMCCVVMLQKSINSSMLKIVSPIIRSLVAVGVINVTK